MSTTDPVTLPESPKDALEFIQGYLNTLSLAPDRQVFQDGELVGYWQCADWLTGLLDIAADCSDVIARLGEHSLIGQASALVQIREAMGDKEGRWMQDELVAKVQAMAVDYAKMRQALNPLPNWGENHHSRGTAKVMTMKQEHAIRNAVAKLSGNEARLACPNHPTTIIPHKSIIEDHCFKCRIPMEWRDQNGFKIPKYTRDLNIIREAIDWHLFRNPAAATEFAERHAAYEAALKKVTRPSNRPVWLASAAQHCMALLETLAPGQLAEIMGKDIHHWLPS